MWFPVHPLGLKIQRAWLALVLLWLAGWASSHSQLLVFSDHVFQWVEQRYGPAARQRVEHLQRLIDLHRQDPEINKVASVNRFFNRVRYGEDNLLWDRKDYWATPFEVLGLNAADCEDYALSKYFTLVSMGVPEEKLRVTYVKSIKLGRAHMVLAYYSSPAAEPVILDNLIDNIEPARKRTDLVPVYSFNGADLWLSVNLAEGKKVGASDRIKLWQEFQKKLVQQMGEGS